MDHLSVRVITPPATEPVTVAECKLEARVDGSDEDSLFAEWIAESRDEVEDACRRALITRTLEVTLIKFPRVRRISLPYPPLVEVNAITYYDQDNVQQTMAESDYIVVADDTPGYVHLAEGASWPTTNLHDDPRIRIEYEAGHGTTAASVPAEFRGAIRSMTVLRYDCRSGWTPDAERKRQRVLAWVERKYGW